MCQGLFDIFRMVEKCTPVFRFLQELGKIPEKQMYKVFNMGIGMAIIIPPESYITLKDSARKKNEDIIKLGEVTKGAGKVRIKGIDL